MEFDLGYFISKIESLKHPDWKDKKDSVVWILSNFINKNLIEELVNKPIKDIKVKLKYIKKYMHCLKDVVYIEELIEQYEKENVTTLRNLEYLSKQLDRLTEYVNDLYTKSLKNNDILYFDDNLDEYFEILNIEDSNTKNNNYKFFDLDIEDETIEILNDIEKTKKLIKLSPKQLRELDINDEAIEILKDLEKTLVLRRKDDNIEIIDYLDKTKKIPKLTPNQLKKLDIDDDAIEVLKDLEKTLKIPKQDLKKLDINDKTIEVLDYLEKTMSLNQSIPEDIEVLDYLEKTIKIPKQELKKLDINDETIEVLKHLEDNLISKEYNNEDVEILDYLEKTIKLPKLTRNELKKLDINDDTIEVLSFLDKTRKIPIIKESNIKVDDIAILKGLEKSIKINRYQITDNMLKKIERKKKLRKIAYFSILTILCIILFICTFRIVIWHQNNLEIKKEIEEIVDNTEIIEFTNDNENIENEEKKDEFQSTTFIDVNFDDLLLKNKDTIGWIYVGGTNINYPFVKTNDNKYYLTHSFNDNYNEAGWIFMDYRNKVDEYDANTIIYGHGRIDKSMFGSLRNSLEEDWFNNKENHYIKIAMKDSNTIWQVFSTYKIETETYYLQNNFNSYYEHDSFIETIKNRSVHDFDVNVTTNDKILTLSTCYDNFTKAVMHAKLIRKYDK